MWGLFHSWGECLALPCVGRAFLVRREQWEMESREMSKTFVVLFWILCHKVLDQRLVFPGHISQQLALPSQNYWLLFKLLQQVTPLVVVSHLKAENAVIQVHSGHSVMFVKWNGIPRNLKINDSYHFRYLLGARWITVNMWVRCYHLHFPDEKTEAWRSSKCK